MLILDSGLLFWVTLHTVSFTVAQTHVLNKMYYSVCTGFNTSNRLPVKDFFIDSSVMNKDNYWD